MRGARARARSAARSQLLLLLLLLLLNSTPLSFTFTPKDNYLLFFTPAPLLLSTPPNSTSHHIPLNSTSPHPFSFSFPISSPGNPHLLRLHFLPSPTSLFSVAASAFPLLSHFSPSAPTFKEFFFFHLNLPSLDLTFTPAAAANIASVTAVELYSVPDDLFSTPSAGHVLEVVHRVNVGGPLVTPENDTLWRTWVPDDGFLQGGRTGEVVRFSGRILFPDGGATPETAPESVYGTCREMGWTGNSSSDKFNLTWVLPVPSSDHGYLVRLHFCDIVSKALYELYFDVYINGFSAYKNLDLSSQSLTLASPYYTDFVVNSDHSGSIRISVGPSDWSLPSKINAILNGLEIMKIHGVAKFSEPRKKNYFGIIIGTVLGCFVLMCLVLAFLAIVLRRRRKRKQKQKPASSESAAPLSPLPGNSCSRLMELTAAASSASNLNLSLKIPFPEILLATNNFDDKSLVGSGGFGKVYRGVLRDGTAVAVKRGGRNDGSGGSRQGLTEFQAEILVLTRIRHRHLVSLIGYCDERSEMILVYEYMANGPLKDHLYGSTKPHLSWKQRLEICIGSARGLHYLHTGTSQGIIIHRDVKSANILLDESYTAKVADFGLSRSAGPHIDQTQTHVSTGVKGSFGYLDPEYFRTQQLTEKSDVYSFGVVLLEVLCARPVIDRLLSWEEVNLAEWGVKWQKKGELDKIIDPLLKDEIDPESLKKFGETVAKCLAQYGVDRPAIGDVLWNLECALQLHESAIRQRPLEDCSTGLSEVSRVRSGDVTAAGTEESLEVATSQVPQLASSTKDGI